MKDSNQMMPKGKESWPSDIVKGSENLSGQKSEEGSEMKVEGEYMGKRDEMILEVSQKEQDKKLVNKTNRRTISKLGQYSRISNHW